MTALEALEYCKQDFVVIGPGYAQAELQYIWEHGRQPIAEIMSLGFTRGEAMRLWNARKTASSLEEQAKAAGIRLRKLSELKR